MAKQAVKRPAQPAGHFDETTKLGFELEKIHLLAIREPLETQPRSFGEIEALFDRCGALNS